jgi:hypothetical protein
MLEVEMELDIYIDSVTNCLILQATGEVFDTEYRLVTRTISKADALALKHIRNQYYTHVDIVEAAPHNIGKNGRYKGVGAHLFAIACKLSWDAGNEGYVQFTAKTDLVEHYTKTLGAHNIDWHTMYIDSYGAVKLIKKYFKDGT